MSTQPEHPLPATPGGISISGSQISGQIGQHVSGNMIQHNTTVTGPAADVEAQLAQLEQLLAAHRDQVPGYEGAKRDVEDVRQGVKDGAGPDHQDRIVDALARLAKKVGSVTVLAAAAEKLSVAVRALF